ncbi:MAG: DUF2029 domain-containing protein, partial [Candidatus Melainabacteria bacterium]|nr:DUF2029 domain-containing protein [Candidatus Melainabacteria bacterium]
MKIPKKCCNLLPFAYAAFLGCWLVGSFVLIGRLMQQGLLFFSTTGSSLTVSDFAWFHYFGKIVFSELNNCIYDPTIQLQWFNQMISPGKVEHILFLQYPPFFFVVLGPLCLLPITTAYFVWLSLSLIAGCIGITLTQKAAGLYHRQSFWFIVLGTAAFFPAWLNFRFGQLGWFVLLMCSLYAWSFLKQRDILAGIALGLSTLKLQYSLFLAVPALACARWKLLTAGALSELVLILVAGFTVGWNNVWTYPQVI